MLLCNEIFYFNSDYYHATNRLCKSLNGQSLEQEVLNITFLII